MRGRVFQAAVCLVVLGCGDGTPEPTASPPQPTASTAFDPATTGVISGRVLWEDDVPAPELLDMRTDPPVARGMTMANPTHPQVDPASKGIAHAIVSLRGVEPRKARPWDHPPVRVEMRALALHVHQGDADSRIGIARAGDTVDFVSRQPTFHALEVRGAAFFSLRFVDAERVTKRRLDAKGVVDLTSAAGYYWMRAYLLVDEHPYYARTDAQGRFHLKQVPPGAYQLVCWLPNYHIKRRERDPENGLVTRLVYAPPLEIERSMRLEPKQEQEMSFTISAKTFTR